MNPIAETALGIGAPAGALLLLVVLDRMAAAWHRLPASPAREDVPAEPASARRGARQYHGPSAADRVPYDTGPLTFGTREET